MPDQPWQPLVPIETPTIGICRIVSTLAVIVLLANGKRQTGSKPGASL
jgi:hypothetical protein